MQNTIRVSSSVTPESNGIIVDIPYLLTALGDASDILMHHQDSDDSDSSAVKEQQDFRLRGQRKYKNINTCLTIFRTKLTELHVTNPHYPKPF